MTNLRRLSYHRLAPLLSRRDLFRTAGFAGGAMLLGLPNFLGGLFGEAKAAVSEKTVAPGFIALELDGQIVGLLRSVAGGNAFAEVVTNVVAPGVLNKSPSPVKFEDIVIELPLSIDSKVIGPWVNDSLAKNPPPKNGAILYADFNSTVVKRLEFTNAVITEVAFAPADASGAKEVVSFLLRLTPQSTRLAGGTGKLQTTGTSKQLLQGNFRFNVQGLESACKRIAKVEGLAAKRSIASVGSVADMSKQINPGQWNSSLISIRLPEADAGPFYTWADDVLLKGKPGTERGGLLEWLDPTLKTIFASVQLGGLGIVRYAPEPVKAGQPGIGLVQIDMYYETINVSL